MTIELFANAASTTVGTGGIDIVSTSLPVASSAAPFPQTGNFRVIVDHEIMLVTAIPDGGHFTVARGQEGTGPASHSVGASVKHILTAGSLNQFRADSILSGIAANRPTAGVAGRTYLTTDAPYIYQDNGVAWTPGWLSWPLNPPNPAWIDYSWINQGSATITINTNGVTTLYCPPQPTYNLRIWAKNAPKPPYTYTIGITATLFGDVWYNRCGIVLYDGTKAITLGEYTYNNSPSVGITQWNNLSSINGDYWIVGGAITSVGAPACRSSLYFLRVSDDGANRRYYVSVDNISYPLLISTSRTDWITPTKIGIFVTANNSGGGSMDASMTVLHLVG